MARLVSQLTLGNTLNLYTAYMPGSIVCLERTDDNQWAMNWMVRPEVVK
jgi:phosphohistidine phosphatase